MSGKPRTTPGPPRFSSLDALLLAPLATPFLLPPLGLLGWVGYRIGAGYVAALQAPAAPASWWQWPWSWPGVRLVEAIHGALGLPSASDFPFSNPLHLIADLAVIDQALMAFLVNGVIALIPLCLVALLIGAVARTCLWARKEAGMTDALRPTN